MTSNLLKTNGKVALPLQTEASQSHSIPEICASLGISRVTLYHYVKETPSTEYLALNQASCHEAQSEHEKNGREEQKVRHFNSPRAFF
ncbi:MAG TPA: hypothetical protein VK140_07925 [Ktedonobacteraceae bacterium]|nr:hypothetical protein [Ktedonobacteraceae bacterium]